MVHLTARMKIIFQLYPITDLGKLIKYLRKSVFVKVNKIKLGDCAVCNQNYPKWFLPAVFYNATD